MKHLLTSLTVLALGAGACVDAPGDDRAIDAATGTDVAALAPRLTWSRTRVAGDVYHYQLTIPVGTTASAALRLHRVVRERAPGVPRPAAHAALLLHGDFATFATNFLPGAGQPASPAPGLATYLATHGVDVWGLDRRWTLPATDGDLSDFGDLGVAQEIDDVRAALALARATRALDGSGGGRPALVGFSHGGQLAYLTASVDAARPAAQRQVGAVAALDFYGAVPPDRAAEQALFCDNAALEAGWLADGWTDAPNDFFIALGELARSAPDADSPLWPGLTNQQALATTLGQTWLFAPFTPWYHLLTPTVDGDGVATGFAAVSDAAASAWLAGAPPHQSLREAAELDALLCPTMAPPIDAPLGRIAVPVMYLGAAGGVGDLGAYTTTQVGSTDVTVHVARRLAPGDELTDVGHGDLLYATDAEALAWRPLHTWLTAR